MMKKLLLCALTAVSVSFMAACSGASKVQAEQKEMFVKVYGKATSSFSVVYHVDTKVMYAVSNGAHNSGTVTLLVNPDGTPMVWEGE